MLLLGCFAFFCLLPAVLTYDIEGIEPGQCLSKFDYDFKIVQTLARLEGEIKDLRNEIKELEHINEDGRDNGKDRRPTAFMAELSSNMVNPSKNTVVVFDNVLTNIGGNYKSQLGIFIADSPGIYNFILVATSQKKSRGAWLHLFMMHNEKKISYVFLDDNAEFFLIRSTTAVVELNTGDSVFVKIGDILGTSTLNGNYLHTHFSGFRISCN